jgi:hemerythrin
MNDLLVWNDEWNTGIPDVDEMHLAMAVKLNQVFELFRACCEAAEHEHLLRNALNEFLELTREHFGAEEEKMRHSNYPDYANHKKEHIMLVAELVQYIRELEKRVVAMDAMTQSNLKNWLIAHIVIADKAFASYYHTNNTRP